jgi:DNA polymerase (family 10)
MQDALQVARGLEEIAALLTFSGEARFKVKAYEHAARVVKTVGNELGALVEQDRLCSLQGIGAALSRQIQELWNTGASDFLCRLRLEHPAGAAELLQVEGLTPRRIRALHAALGIGSVEELRVACAAARVRTVRGFGPKTEQRLCEACERWRNRGEAAPRRVLLARALELAACMEHELLKVVEEAHLAGAVRRGEETVDQLDFVICGDAGVALRHLAELRQVLRIDLDQRVAHLSEGLRLKLHVGNERLGNTLLLATGNTAHVDAVHLRAEAQGVSLANGRPSPAPSAPLPVHAFATENALYQALGLSFVPPELREGRDELDAAARGDFSDLVELGDVQGMVHCHTTYSDGKNTITEMASAAHALGMKYITITDHSPSAHYAGGVTVDRLKQQWDDIAAAEQRVPIRILRGTESDILADGSLDFPDSVLEQFDVVIASIHARHRQDRSAMTDRLVRAMSLPVFKIWGHALGRILNHRESIDCDVPAVLDALAKSRGAIELNADPHRLDLPPLWIPAARQRNIPFVISVDAHSTGGFGVLRYGVIMARRGGVRRHEVLNTAPPDVFAAAVRPA